MTLMHSMKSSLEYFSLSNSSDPELKKSETGFWKARLKIRSKWQCESNNKSEKNKAKSMSEIFHRIVAV